MADASMPSVAALPSLRQLSYLVVLAEKLNFRQAADALFVTQSTLSAGIKELEATVGAQLVERDTRVVRLTPLGEAVTKRAKEMIASAYDLMDLAHGASKPLSGPFRLGVIPTIAPFLLPNLLPRVRSAYPDLRLFLREDQTERVIEKLRAGELDAGIIALPWDTGELVVQPLFKDEFWFVARATDPESKQKEIAVRDIDLGRLVLLEEGHCLRDHAIAACGRRASGLSPSVEATSLHTLIQMVEGGIGVTLLPEMTLKAGILNGTHLIARPFSTQVPARTIALVNRPTAPRSEDFRLLAELIEEEHRNAMRARGATRKRVTR